MCAVRSGRSNERRPSRCPDVRRQGAGLLFDVEHDPPQQGCEGVEFVVGQSVEHVQLTGDAARVLGFDDAASGVGEVEQYDATVAFEPFAFEQSESDEAVGVLGGGGARHPGDGGDLAGPQRMGGTAGQRAQHLEFRSGDPAPGEFVVELVQCERADPDDAPDDVDGGAGVQLRVGLGPRGAHTIDEVVGGGDGGVGHGLSLAIRFTDIS